ncbi:hypothetical protein ABB37_06019 [Leptomonas pyrrhocoris]|uniref:Uncharacterized protein n=1 Tax=Leptomonas pyrrhocoris TaxID=157538 RepID=A0A0M9FYY5_LEPPY|nr:hypothetical protein ABB37_06019 [Leptomonas pyrrhocoris]KPA78955.1 hypothetical protein ABB37_06019 [Leptomonas pyrrhocoris]|eukprot:XP_015657394.1 hypothetical protein ABB37_06019 [Leptomonas pyrrhocoris]
MFSCCRARYVVKVLSAALMESLPLNAANKGALAYRATLVFHLHRSNAAESYGIACAFGVLGDFNDVCFVRSITPALVAGSSVLSGVLRRGGKAVSEEALRVLSVNGEVSPTEERLKELMERGRDVVFQCAVAAPVEGGADAAADADQAGGKGEEKKAKSEAEIVRTQKRRRRTHRPPIRAGIRRVLKHAQNKGSRATMPHNEDEEMEAVVDAVEGTEFEEEAAAGAVGDLASAKAAHVTEEVMEALQSMQSGAPPPPSKPKRHRRTKAEMAAARLQMAAVKETAAVKPEGVEVGDRREDVDEIWFRREQRADSEAAQEPPTAPRRRGRRSGKKAVAEAEADSTQTAAPMKKKRQGRTPKAAKKATKPRRSRKATTSTDVGEPEEADVKAAEMPNAGEAVEEEDVDAEEMDF